MERMDLDCLNKTIAEREAELQELNSDLRDKALIFMAGKSIAKGGDSVQKVLNIFRERGGSAAEVAEAYYGSVIENFTCAKAIYTAVEVTAGNSLFHHIVKSDKVGTQILKEMKRQRLHGEVTFMPLNRLRTKPQNYSNKDDAMPIITKLHYDGKYDPVMKYIFGKTLLCRNFNVARRYARAEDLDCVTLDGDHVSSNGSLTGGNLDSSRTRLEMQKTRTELKEQIRECEQKLHTLREELKK